MKHMKLRPDYETDDPAHGVNAARLIGKIQCDHEKDSRFISVSSQIESSASGEKLEGDTKLTAYS